MTEYIIHRDDELKHYGVPGTKWGIRRYQNPDGSYKPGAEGRYYQPVKKSISGTTKNVSTLSGGKSVASGGGSKNASKSTLSSSARKLHESRGSVIEEGQKKVSGGGGGSKPADKKEEEIKKENESSEKPMNKTADGKDIKLYSVDEKLDTSKEANKKKSSSSSSSEKQQKTEAEFKVSQLLDKIENYFDMDDMSDEDWEEMDLDDSDIKEIDELVSKYREWRSNNKSKTKKTKTIDTFIERYEAWKSSHGKHSEQQEIFLMHHGILGMKWGIRRYQKSDGTLTEAGKQRYNENPTNRHETAWYQKAKEHGEGKPYHTKNRVSKSDTRLDAKLKLRDQQEWGRQHHLEDAVERQQETYKKHGYDVGTMNMFESREVNSQKQMDTRIARREILEKREETEEEIHELLEEGLEKIEEETINEGKSFLQKIKDFFTRKFK